MGDFVLNVVFVPGYGRNGGWVIETQNHNPDNTGAGRDDFQAESLEEAFLEFAQEIYEKGYPKIWM